MLVCLGISLWQRKITRVLTNEDKLGFNLEKVILLHHEEWTGDWQDKSKETSWKEDTIVQMNDNSGSH
jgi:hypothetical protein